MKTRSRYFAFLMVLFLTLLAVGLVRAQDQPPEQGPPPDSGQQGGQAAPGVARVSVVDGAVSTQRAGSGEWVAATVNAFVGRGDSVSTGDRSRAELELDYADLLRLDQRTEVNVADLTPDRIQLQMAGGQASYSIFNGGQAQVEIDTPNMAVHPVGAGDYRIRVDSPTETSLIVRSGEAEVSTAQGSSNVKQGEMIQVRGSDNPEYQIVEAPAKDKWDEWNQERDRAIYDAQSWRDTNRHYTGSEDLDRYGQWKQAPGYGDVWVPEEGSDWAPYRDGRWVWDPNYGWTWVSDEPWGWAPYHYGRWFWDDDAWAWWPGPVYPAYYPVWSPAYVTFFGFGRHVGFGFGFGSIGWFPVGPCDPFFPWWGGVGFGFGFGFGGGWGGGFGRFGGARFTNITNITNINNINNGGRVIGPLAGPRGGRATLSNAQAIMNNSRARMGVSSMNASQFGSGRVPMHQGAISAATLRGGQALTRGLPAAPSRASLSFTNHAAAASSIPRNSGSQHFFATRQPPAGRAPSFAQQSTRIQNAMHNPASASANSGNRGFAPGARTSGVGASRTASSFQQPGPRGGANAQTAAGVHSFQGQPAARPSNSTASWRQFSRSTPSSGQMANRTSAFGRNGPAASSFGRQSAPAHTFGTQPAPRGGSPSESGSQAGWRRFSNSPGASRASTSSGSRYSGSPSARGGQPTAGFGGSRGSSGTGGGSWQRFSSQPAPRSGSRSGNNGSYGRQQLDLHKSITGAPRYSSSGSFGSGRGYSSPRPSYNSGTYGGSRSVYSSPRAAYGGGYNSGSRGGYGGGYSSPRASYSARSGGGGSRSSYSGGSRGGGGGYHGGGGGGRSGGGHSSGRR